MPFPKPKIPLGTNKMGTTDLYFHRKSYQQNVLYKEGSRDLKDGVVDLWDDRHLYGKVNDIGDFIVPKENLFSFLTTSDDKSRFALNFVAQAYNEMFQAMVDDQIFSKAMAPDSPFNNFTVSKSWTSVYNRYHKYIKDVFSIMVEQFSEGPISNKITNFQDFLDQFFGVFFDYMMQNKMPLTLSGFVGSRLSPSNTGGLLVEISKATYANDKVKFASFINDPSFKLFHNYARKYGFVIDKNIPWRLVANLKSEYMRDKMNQDHGVFYKPSSLICFGSRQMFERGDQEKYGNNAKGSPYWSLTELFADEYSLQSGISLRSIFDTYYFRTYELDMKFLKTYLTQMYRSLVSQSPVYKTYQTCKGGQRKRIKKKRLGLAENAEQSYNVKDFWLDYYFMIRIAETGASFNRNEIKLILSETKKVYALRGELKALNFLNRKLKKRHQHIYKSLGQVVQDAKQDGGQY